MLQRLLYSFIVLALLKLVAPAEARVIEEVRVGVVAHNVSFVGDQQSDETGANIEVEVVGKPVRALRRIGAPRPYALAST